MIRLSDTQYFYDPDEVSRIVGPYPSLSTCISKYRREESLSNSCSKNFPYARKSYREIYRVLGVEHLQELLPAFETCLANDFKELKGSLKPEQLKAFLLASEGLNTSMFVSCWHEAAYESAALWSQYASGAGLAVKSSIARVKRAIIGGPNYNIGRVNYLDFKNDPYRGPDVNALISPFLKRKSFEHEREVRILVWDPDKIGPPNPGTSLPDGIELPLGLDDLIEALYISPEASTWLSVHIVELLRRFGLPNLPVIQSTLYDKHVY